MSNFNPKSLLFLYEGNTEFEFYRKVFDLYLPKRQIRTTLKNLHGISTNINRKVFDKINEHLTNYTNRHQIHVFVAIDRDGPIDQESPLNIEELRYDFIYPRSRIKSINEIIATQDIESWLFIDIDGIYRYLRVPRARRYPQRYNNIEALNHFTLSQLFKNYGRVYLKGNRVKGFLDTLSIEKIYEGCAELRTGIQKMIELTNL